MIVKGMAAYGVSVCSEHDGRKEHEFKRTEYPCVTQQYAVKATNLTLQNPCGCVIWHMWMCNIAI